MIDKQLIISSYGIRVGVRLVSPITRPSMARATVVNGCLHEIMGVGGRRRPGLPLCINSTYTFTHYRYMNVGSRCTDEHKRTVPWVEQMKPSNGSCNANNQPNEMKQKKKMLLKAFVKFPSTGSSPEPEYIRNAPVYSNDLVERLGPQTNPL